ncbi:hypothetical protein Scep_019241 [Stephania cephalantha]|uniref:Reverse transcriptase domain-containing protein n=1 Tax=Stephania cephalantha TaxID=152367 RepID=A0AAP0IAZ2_9MAGN
MALEFYKNLYRKEVCNVTASKVRNLFPTLSTSMLTMLGAPICVKEVRCAVFDISQTKSLGVDGFLALFYQKNWHVVSSSIFKMVSNCFITGKIEEEVSKTIITLIPKVDGPKSLNQFRPISLCIVLYKVITKVIASRLKSVTPILVNPAQTSFIPGRHITKNIIITQEMIHSMRLMKGKICWFAIKIDLEKAYDHLSWDFICDTLVDAHIPSLLTKVLLSSLQSNSSQVVWNEELSASFKPSR